MRTFFQLLSTCSKQTHDILMLANVAHDFNLGEQILHIDDAAEGVCSLECDDSVFFAEYLPFVNCTTLAFSQNETVIYPKNSLSKWPITYPLCTFFQVKQISD
jgi:hypothetical protein